MKLGTMEVTQPKIDETVIMLIERSIDDRCLNVMNLITASPTSAEAFVKTLVARKVEAGGNLDAVLPEIQELFEQVADYSESTACVFMAHLWPIASEQIGMHDVCDSIDLWLANAGYKNPSRVQ